MIRKLHREINESTPITMLHKLNEVIDAVDRLDKFRQETLLAINAIDDKVGVLEKPARKEETPDPYSYGRCEVPVGYAVMREKQAIADYKKRLIEKLEDESLVLDWVIKLVEETE